MATLLTIDDMPGIGTTFDHVMAGVDGIDAVASASSDASVGHVQPTR